MRRSFSRHLGATVSAMVDGQLSAAETDRAWRHALECGSCRAEVERELWLKRQLASLQCPGPGHDLADSLSRMPQSGPVVAGWSSVVADDRTHRRRTGVAVGVGAASVVALMGWGVTVLVDETGTAPAGANVGGTPSARPVGTTPPAGGADRGSVGLPAPTR